MPRPCGAFRQNSLEHSEIFFVGRVDPNRARKFQELHDLHFLFATLGQPVIFVSVNADFRHRSIEMLTDYRLGYGIDCQLRVNIRAYNARTRKRQLRCANARPYLAVAVV